MKKKEHMVRVTDEVYKQLVMKRAEFINKYDAYFTMSEIIDAILAEAKLYEQK